MKKAILLLMPCVLLVVLTSCANNPGSASSQAVSSAVSVGRTKGSASYVIQLNPVASNVCFREGTTKDGPVTVTAKDIAGFYAENSREAHTEQIVFQLTDEGKKSMAETTERLSKSGGSMSIWVGETKLWSGSVFAPITDGKDAFTEPDAEQTKKDCVMLSIGHPAEIQSRK